MFTPGVGEETTKRDNLKQGLPFPGDELKSLPSEWKPRFQTAKQQNVPFKSISGARVGMSMDGYIDNLQVYNHLHLLYVDAVGMTHDEY